MKLRFAHLFSGGIDSTVMLYDILEQGGSAYCLLFLYGQRHSKELDYAQETCGRLGVDYTVIELPHQVFKRSALTGGMPKVDLVGGPTVVPNRNMVFLSIAAGFAVSHDIKMISWAANRDDAMHYPDCRPAFRDYMEEAFDAAETGVRIHAPFLGMTKADVVRLGRRLNVPFDKTWSCYAGDTIPCGECGACIVREKALAC